MGQDIFSGPLGELRTAGTAGGGTALTTAAGLIALPDGTNHVVLIPRNYSTAAVAKVAMNPYLIALFTSNLLSTATDASQNMQDGLTGTVLTLNSWPTFANNGALYIGSHLPFRGVSVTVGNTNSIVSVLTVKYWNGTAWTDISATDNTASGGASFAQSGTVVWTVPTTPTTWVPASLVSIASPAPGLTVPYRSNALFWTRWEVSVAFDSTVTATGILPLNRSTAYWEIPSGFTFEQRIHKGLGGFSCVEALTDAGTASLVVNVASGDARYGFGG